MAFEQIIPVKNEPPESIKNNTPVSPTLVLGLGGTGKEVLLRLRRLIVERFGSLKELPCVEFLHIDTDQKQTAKEQYDLKADDDVLFKKIMFQPTETIPLTIEGGTKRYISYIDKYPHVKKWFQNKGKIAGLGDLGGGAGQIRMASRLAFFHGPNFAKISDTLNRVKAKLQDPTIAEKVAKHHLAFAPQSMEIYIITSVGGGTGSGIFLDVGFLVKQIFGDSERVGMLFMPKLYEKYPGHSRIYANGYAALMELNKYSFGHKFLADWNGRNLKDMLPPPFSYTYLIDAANESGFTENNEKSIYQMVAETIFQDYSIGGFAGMKRSTRVNLVQYTMGVYGHDYWDGGKHRNSGTKDMQTIQVKGDTYPTRFSSMGLGVISFPAAKVHNACAARLAQHIMTAWQNKLTDDPLESLITSFLTLEDIHFFQGEYDRRDGGGCLEQMDIEDQLLYYNKSAGQTFENYLWEKCLNAQQEIQSTAKGSLAAVLRDHRGRFDQLMAKEDSEKPKEWGEDIRLIQDNMRSYLKRLTEGIKKEADRLANSPDYGIAYALSILRALKDLLPKGGAEDSFKYLLHFEESIPMWREVTTDYMGKLEQLHVDLDKHDRGILFRKDDIQRDLDLLIGTKSEPGILYNYMFARVMKQVAKRGKQICLAVDEFLGKNSLTGKGLLSEYLKLLGGFDKLNTLFKRKEEYFSKDFYTEKGYSFWVSLYRDGDVNHWYQRWMGTGKNEEENVEEVGNRLLKRVFRVESVTEALAHIERTPEEEIEEEVIRYCKKYFADLDDQPSALEILMDSNRFTKAQREQKIKQTHDMARVWVKGGGIDHVNVMSPGSDQKPFYIGIDSSDPIRRKEFLDIVDKNKSAGEIIQPLDIGKGNRSSIVFYNELAGITAFYPNSVSAQGGLKHRYNEFYTNSSSFDPNNQEELHTDKNRFQFSDLIPKTDDEAIRYKKAIRAFVMARLLGMLRAEETGGNNEHSEQIFCYEYFDPYDNNAHEETLGDELNAIDMLYREVVENGSWREQISDAVDEAVNRLLRQKKMAHYLLLIEFYLKEIYPPLQEKDKDREDMFITRFSPQYAILESERRDIYEKILIDPQAKTQVVNAMNSLRGRTDGKGMSYRDYIEVLKPFTKKAGKFERIEETNIGELRTSLYDALALDPNKLGLSKESVLNDSVKKSAHISTPVILKEEEEKTGIGPETMNRACPMCGKEINIRAVFCYHCKNKISRHVECPQCGETHVPEDLKSCWSCGHLMTSEETITCPRCYEFTGYKKDFPCNVCGFDFHAEEKDHHYVQTNHHHTLENQAPTVPEPIDSEPESEPIPRPIVSPPPPLESETNTDSELSFVPGTSSNSVPPTVSHSLAKDEASDSRRSGEDGTVECLNCFSIVPKASHCEDCGAPLDN